MSQKIIKMIIKASKLSNRNMEKSLNSMKNFIKRFKNVFFKILTVWEKKHLRNDFFVEYFLLFEARFKCGRVIYGLFDKWVDFYEKLLGADFMVFGRSSLLYFYLSGDLGYF